MSTITKRHSTKPSKRTLQNVDAYPALVHLWTYRRTRHHLWRVRGCKDEGTNKTTFDMPVLNERYRFHWVIDTIDRLPQTADMGVPLKQLLLANPQEHFVDIRMFGVGRLRVRSRAIAPRVCYFTEGHS